MPAATPAPAAPPTSTPTPAPPSAPSTPMGDAFDAMARFADPEEGDQPAPSKPTPPPSKPARTPSKPDKAPSKPSTPPPAKPGEQQGEVKMPEGEEGQAKPGEEGKPGQESKPGEEGKPGRQSPWRLVESYKAKAAQLEAELAKVRTGSKELPPEHQERLKSIEARNKELEEEIRFVNYSKSKDYVETYQKPYQEAWASALADIAELTITNEDGTTRAATRHDLHSLANMGLGQARATAKQWFGDAADDVMAHRRTLIDLSNKQAKALEDARKNGSERELKMREERQAKMKARAEETSQIWNTVNAEHVEKYEYLRPVEGQQERNDKLDKATKFVDETFGLNVNNARTSEERDQIIRRHAALRNRAIGFSVLKHENVSLKAQLAELQKELEQFKQSEPTGGDPRRATNGEPGADSMEGMMAQLAKMAT